MPFAVVAVEPGHLRDHYVKVGVGIVAIDLGRLVRARQIVPHAVVHEMRNSCWLASGWPNFAILRQEAPRISGMISVVALWNCCNGGSE